MTDKVYSFLGLATKARKLLSGEDTCERAIKSQKAELVIVAADASENTKKKFTHLCESRNVTIKFFGSKELLGRYIGKEIRSVVVIIEQEFAKRLVEMVDHLDRVHGGE